MSYNYWLDKINEEGMVTARKLNVDNLKEIVSEKIIHPEKSDLRILLNRALALLNEWENIEGKENFENVKGKVDELKKLLEPKEKDVALIKNKLEELNSVVQKYSTELYKHAQQEQAKQQGQEQAKEKPKEDKVVDADFKVEDEKKDDKGKKEDK